MGSEDFSSRVGFREFYGLGLESFMGWVLGGDVRF